MGKGRKRYIKNAKILRSPGKRRIAKLLVVWSNYGRQSNKKHIGRTK